MKFGVYPIDEIEDALLVHSLRTPDGTLRKGRRLTADDIISLRKAGFSEVTVARLDPTDVPEDAAAGQMAEAVCIDDTTTLGAAGTGRVNIYSATKGLFIFAEDRLDAINLIDESVTLATIPPYSAVEPGQLVATVKIIPFAVERDILSNCQSAARRTAGVLRVAPFQRRKVGLIQTTLPEFRRSLLTKGVDVTSARLSGLGLALDMQQVCKHDTIEIENALRAFSDAGCEIVLILGASAISDRRDVVPAAITAAGGRIEQLGMPVDPGNLTLIAGIGDMAVIGLPGSARSPRLHGSDWVIQRIAAGFDVTATDIRRMGAGGLLKEIPSRPMPRTQASPPQGKTREFRPNVAAIVLAAGQSRRMGPQNKLLAEIDGLPMVRRTLEAVSAADVSSVTVVLGHEADEVRLALKGLDLEFIENHEYAGGLSTSLKRGLSVVPPNIDAALICLGDMPRISPEQIDKLISAFAPSEDHFICVPTFGGKRGNPVLLGRRFFAEIQDISGDVGARYLIGAYPDLVHEVEMSDDAVLVDIDTPEALARITG